MAISNFVPVVRRHPVTSAYLACAAAVTAFTVLPRYLGGESFQTAAVPRVVLFIGPHALLALAPSWIPVALLSNLLHLSS